MSDEKEPNHQRRDPEMTNQQEELPKEPDMSEEGGGGGAQAHTGSTDRAFTQEEEDQLDREAAELLSELHRSESEIHHLSMQHAEHQCMLSSMKQTLSMDLEEARLERWCLEQHQELEDLKNRLVASRLAGSGEFDESRLVKDGVEWEELACADTADETGAVDNVEERGEGVESEVADATAALEAEMEREWEEVRNQLSAAKAAQAALEKTRAGLLAEIAQLKQAVTENEPLLGVTLEQGPASASDPSPQIATIQV